MNRNPNDRVAVCPECMSNVRFKQGPELGDLVNCPECNTLLEVVDDHPILLDWADGFDDEDELDDDFDDEDE